MLPGRALAKPADYREAQPPGALQEGPLGVAAVGHHPELLEMLADPAFRPVQSSDGHLQLGAEVAGALGRQLGQVDPTNVYYRRRSAGVRVELETKPFSSVRKYL